MSTRSLNNRILFGLMIKQLRQEHGLSFSELAAKSGLSVSYLNEIEKGKKYPKSEKLKALAEALKVEVYKLEQLVLPTSLAPVKELLQSNFLNELPLELFGIDLSKVAGIIANSPLRVGAFISTLVEISRNYALKESHFYFGALRAYQELNFNFFEDIEAAALRISNEYGLNEMDKVPLVVLEKILKEKYRYKIESDGLKDFPEFKDMRSLFIPKGKRLLLHEGGHEMQKAFQYGKEIGFNYLELKGRSLTSSLVKVDNFDTVLTHATAAYFSVALLIPLERFVKDLSDFFANKKWDGQAFTGLSEKYNAVPEMLYQRLTNVLPTKFGIKKLFFMRVLHDPENDSFKIDKELHLQKKHHPHSNGLQEHYCRRWLAISLLSDLNKMQQAGKYAGIISGAQRSHYFGTEDEYLCFTLARPAYPGSKFNVSLTIGMAIDDALKETIAFVDDPAIQSRIVNNTCERCGIVDCKERAVAPIKLMKREKRKQMLNTLDRLEKRS